LDTHAAVTGADDAVPAPSGTVNAPTHVPLAATGARNATSSVDAVTVTKLALRDPSTPGAHPPPRTCTTVPGGPDAGDIVNPVTAAPAGSIAPTAPTEASPATSATTADAAHGRAATRSRRLASMRCWPPCWSATPSTCSPT